MRLLQMAYNYTCKRFIKRKIGVHGQFFFKAFTWIKPEDFENLTKIPKHDKQTSLNGFLYGIIKL